MKCKFRNCKTNAKHICETCNSNFCKDHTISCSACKKYFCHNHWEDHVRKSHRDFNIRF